MSFKYDNRVYWLACWLTFLAFCVPMFPSSQWATNLKQMHCWWDKYINPEMLRCDRNEAMWVMELACPFPRNSFTQTLDPFRSAELLNLLRIAALHASPVNGVWKHISENCLCLWQTKDVVGLSPNMQWLHFLQTYEWALEMCPQCSLLEFLCNS